VRENPERGQSAGGWTVRGPAARRIENVADVTDVIALMRLNYERIVARHGLPAEASDSS
jgi:hypothetical protein